MAEKTVKSESTSHMDISDVKWIMVLGCKADINNPYLKDRLDNALTAQQLFPKSKIILTGNGNEKEPQVMKDYLLSKGVPESQITTEDQSRSTWQSFVNVKKIIQPSELTLVITNEFHMPRSLATAKTMGYKAASFGKDTGPFKDAWKYLIRERFSRIKWLAQFTLHKFNKK